MCTTVFYIALNVVQRWKREERDWYYTEQSVSLREVQGSNLRNAIEGTERERERQRERERSTQTEGDPRVPISLSLSLYTYIYTYI